jgi:hypothetical protein
VSPLAERQDGRELVIDAPGGEASCCLHRGRLTEHEPTYTASTAPSATAASYEP